VSPPPAVSVVLPAYNSSETIGAALDALDRQRFTDFEIIVVDSSPDDRTSEIVRRRFPHVRSFHQTERLLPHQARNLGAREARGGILAFTDPDCTADLEWLARLMVHHRSGPAMVGGAIESPPGWWNGSVHAAKYAWWLAGSEEGLRSELPSGNLSVARGIWDAVGGFQGEYFAGDSEFCWRVAEAGHRIWFEPRAVVTHGAHPGLPVFVWERWTRGRDFGEMRRRLRGWSRGQCLGRLLAAPLGPFVMTWRSARFAVRRRYLASWLPTLPVQVLGNSLWCMGEAVAHARGVVGRNAPVRSAAR
jgi:glycosyltransferase involved in cell wall biosynthesis